MFQKQGLKEDEFHDSFLRNLSMKLFISLFFKNCTTDFTPHFLSKSWQKGPKFCKKCNLLTLLNTIIFVKLARDFANSAVQSRCEPYACDNMQQTACILMFKKRFYLECKGMALELCQGLSPCPHFYTLPTLQYYPATKKLIL